MIVNIAILGSCPDLTASHSHRTNWVFLLHHPRAHVQVMNMLLHIEVSRKPSEVVPVPHLPFHVTPFRLARLRPDGPAIVIGLHGSQITQLSIMNMANDLLKPLRITEAQAGNHGKIFPSGLLANGQDRPHSWSIDCHGLLCEDVLAGFNGSF